MPHSINSQTKLGILGDGQLARMTAIAAFELGIEVHILAENMINPAAQITQHVTLGSIYNLNDVLNFVDKCDYVTLENEFIPQQILSSIDERFKEKLFPHAKSFKSIGDKIAEKETFLNAGIKVAPFKKISSVTDIQQFALEHQYPVVLKSASGGYDGYGNALIKNEGDILIAYQKLNGDKNILLVEKFIHYKKEVAIVAAQNSTNSVYYPLVETIQENHICHFTVGPAQLNSTITQTILEYTNKALKAIQSRGIFAFEFFIDQNNQVYLNESAPRPHNSGHYTQLACQTSQFHNHVRAVLDLPLGSTEQKYPAFGLLNLLGTHQQIGSLEPLDKFLNTPQSRLELYGKHQSKPGRKMGHFIIARNSIEEVMTELQNLKQIYTL